MNYPLVAEYLFDLPENYFPIWILAEENSQTFSILSIYKKVSIYDKSAQILKTLTQKVLLHAIKPFETL